MSRLKQFLTAVSVAFAVAEAVACGPYIIRPHDMAVYKINTHVSTLNDPEKSRTQASYAAWCEMAGGDVKPEDVESLMSHSIMYVNDVSSNSENSFERWLAVNPAARDYIVLAIQCELTRNHMSDPWWYPGEYSDVRLIEDIEESALSHKPQEMQGRYVLIAVRAMVTQRKWQQCLDYWKSVEKQVTCQAVRDLVEPNIVGCRYHLGDSVGALRDFVRIGDERSVKFCFGQMNVNWMDFAQDNPELLMYESYLRNYLLWLDHTLNSEYDIDNESEEKNMLMSKCRKYRDKCLTIVKKKNPSNSALWLYAAAAMSDALQEYDVALYCCNRAMKAKGHKAIDERIAVLKFHIQVQSMPMGIAYDAMLHRGMKLLTRLTARDVQLFKDNVNWKCRLETYGSDSIDFDMLWLYEKEPYYYWHNMLYRIVVGEAAPRLMKAGKYKLALMTTNVAENYLATVLNVNSGWLNKYGNSTFMLADSLSTSQLNNCWQAMCRPRSKFEKWLAPLCYRDKDYWIEQLGTHCLREMNYEGAIAYLSQVSEDYQKSMNIWPYFKYDPIRHQKVKIEDRLNYKLNYAKSMLDAQNIIRKSKDRDECAEAMLRMAIGLDNVANGEYRKECDEFYDYSPELCGRDWAVLHYSVGWMTPFDEKNKQALRRQLAKSKTLKEQAFATFENQELAARWRVELCEYLIVLKRYPDTVTAQILRGRCDRLRDYQ